MDVLKNDFVEDDEAMLQSVELPFEHIFWQPGHRNKGLEWIHLCEVLSRRISLMTHNLPAGRLKKRILWSRWSNVSKCESPCDFIFCILYIERNDKDEVALRRRMALGTDKLPSERLKRKFGDVNESKFRV
jgi:hypothetical protein